MKRGEKLWRKMSWVCKWRLIVSIMSNSNRTKPICGYLSGNQHVNCRMSRCPALSEGMWK